MRIVEEQLNKAQLTNIEREFAEWLVSDKIEVVAICMDLTIQEAMLIHQSLVQKGVVLC